GGQAHDLADPLIGVHADHHRQLSGGDLLAPRLEHGLAPCDLVAAGRLPGAPAPPPAPGTTGGRRGALVRLVVRSVLGLRRRSPALQGAATHAAGADARALPALAHRTAARTVACHRSSPQSFSAWCRGSSGCRPPRPRYG